MHATRKRLRAQNCPKHRRKNCMCSPPSPLPNTIFGLVSTKHSAKEARGRAPLPAAFGTWIAGVTVTSTLRPGLGNLKVVGARLKRLQPSIESRSAVHYHKSQTYKSTSRAQPTYTGKQSRIMLSPSTLGTAPFVPGTWRLGRQLGDVASKAQGTR